MATTYTVALQDMVSGSANTALASVNRLKGALDNLEARPRRTSSVAIANEWQKMAAQAERAAEREKTAQLRLEAEAIASAKRMEDAKRNAAFRRLQAQQREEERFIRYRIQLDRKHAAEQRKIEEAAKQRRAARVETAAGYATSAGKGIIAGAIGGAMAGGGYVVGQAIDTVKLIEGARMRLTSALGSATRANQEIKDAFSIAEKTIFDPDQMLEAMSKLSTFFKDDQMRRYILGAINDFATTTGKGNEGLQRSIKAITDIQSKGKLQAEELTGQLGEIGLSSADVKQEIAKILQLKGKTDQERNEAVMKLMGKGEVTSDVAIQAITTVMRKQSGGGAAGSAAIKAAGTLESQLSNIRKGFLSLFAMADVAEWPAMQALRDILKEVSSFFSVNSKEGTAFMDALKTAFTAIVPQMEWFKNQLARFSQNARAFDLIAKGVVGIGQAFFYVGLAAAAAGAGIVMTVGLIKDAFNWVVDGASNLISEVIDAIRGSMARIFELGADIGNGLANGIRSARDAVVNAAKGAASSVVTTVADTLEIRSPSRKMMKMGAQSAEGYAIGLEKGAGRIENASAAVGGASMSGLGLGSSQGRATVGGNGPLAVLHLTLPIQTANDAATLAREAGPLLGAHLEAQMDRYFGRLVAQGAG